MSVFQPQVKNKDGTFSDIPLNAKTLDGHSFNEFAKSTDLENYLLKANSGKVGIGSDTLDVNALTLYSPITQGLRSVTSNAETTISGTNYQFYQSSIDVKRNEVNLTSTDYYANSSYFDQDQMTTSKAMVKPSGITFETFFNEDTQESDVTLSINATYSNPFEYKIGTTHSGNIVLSEQIVKSMRDNSTWSGIFTKDNQIVSITALKDALGITGTSAEWGRLVKYGTAGDASLTYGQKVNSSAINNSTDEIPTSSLIYDSLSKKQDSLVSGTNIKTINNNSILGSGNLTITGSVANATNKDNTSAVPDYGAMGMYCYYANTNSGWANIVNGAKGIFIRIGTFTAGSNGTAKTISFNKAMKMCVGSSTTQVSANAISVMLVDGVNMSSNATYRNSNAVTAVSATGFTYINGDSETGTLRYLAIGIYGV